MRKSTYVVLASVALWAAVTASACGSDVNTESSSTSGGVGGHVATTSAETSSSSKSASSSSSSASSTTASSSSSGGGDNCMMACSHVEMCIGFNACAMLPAFDCSDPQNDCIAQCILGASCAMLSFGTIQMTFQGCQAKCMSDGGMSDGGMSDGGASDGGNPQACQTCAQNQCLPQVGACAQDAQCGQWLMCLQGCAQDPNPGTCAFACDKMYPNAAAQYGQVYSCTCNKCINECGVFDPCSHVPG